MIASSEDARLLFSRWQEEAPLLRVRLWTSTLFFDAVGSVSDVSNGALDLAGHAWKFTIPLEGVTFSFSDPREVPNANVREAEMAQYEYGLGMQMPNGDKLSLLEMKGTAEEEEEEPDAED